MPAKEQELQTLNVQNLNAKTNLYGNLTISPFVNKTGENNPFLQKAKSLESQLNGQRTESQYNSMVAIESVNNRNSGHQMNKIVVDKGINRYDSGYGSYVEFQSESSSFHGSRDTLLEEPDQLNDIESINANNQYVISEWQSYTGGDGTPYEDHSYQEYTVSPVESQTIGSDKIGSQSPQKRNEYIRLVERFGNDLKDTCLFPLALPMDGSDVNKGKSDWQSVNMLADCVLIKWIECTQKTIKTVNKVLPNASRYLCPNPELQSRLIQHPNAKLPLRRTNSELDFHKLGFVEREGLVQLKSPIRKPVKSESQVGVKDDIDINVSVEKGRLRANTSLSIRRKSVHFVLPKKRKDRFDLKVGGNLKTDAKSLIQSIKLENPISLALQITRIEKDLMVGLPSDEVMALVLKQGKRLNKSSHLNKLLDFGHELSQLIADIIVREATNEAQGKKIAAIIEVGCVLRKLRNWQSLTSLIHGLQLPQIYGLSNAWTVTRTKYPIHFKDYLKLSRVVRNESIAVLRSREPSIPSVSSFISLMRVRCLATWDRLERAPRWTESPNLVQWLERQMLTSIAIEQSIFNSNERMEVERLKNLKKKKQKIVAVVEKFQESNESHFHKAIKDLSPERQSFLPVNDPIYFIEDDHLPSAWTLRSARNIPAQYQSKIIRCFRNSYELESERIAKYNMNS